MAEQQETIKYIYDTLKVDSTCIYFVNGFEVDLPSAILLKEETKHYWDRALESIVTLEDDIISIRFVSDELSIESVMQALEVATVVIESKIRLQDDVEKYIQLEATCESAILLKDAVLEYRPAEVTCQNAITLSDTVVKYTIPAPEDTWIRESIDADEWTRE